MIAYLIAIRLLDIVSSYLCMAKYGGWESIEMVPLSRYLIKTVGYAAFSIINLVIYAALLLTVYRLANGELRKRVLKAIAVIQTCVVIMNTMIYLWV